MKDRPPDSATIRVTGLDRSSRGMTSFHNFTEAVWAEFRNSGRVQSDLNAVDHGSATLTIHCRTGLTKRVLTRVDEIAKMHMVTDVIQIEMSPRQA